MNKDNLLLIYRYLLLAAGGLAIVFFIWYFINIAAYILFALVFSLIGGPFMRWLKSLRIGAFRIPPALAASIVIISAITLSVSFLRLIIPLFMAEARMISSIDSNQLIYDLQAQLGFMQSIVDQYVELSGKEAGNTAFIAQHIETILNIANISNFVNVLVTIFGNVFIAVFAILFISFFFLKEPKLFLSSLLTLVPDEHTARARIVLRSIKTLLSRYFIGLMIECSLAMVLITGLLWLTGSSLQQAAVIGFISGVLNVIPYIGPIISSLFAGTMGVISGIESGSSELWVHMVVNMVCVGGVFMFNAFVTQPFIHSNSVKAHPLEIFLVILMAGSLAGVPGMILAIPAYTLFRVVAKEFFNSNKLIHKLTKNI